MRTQQRGVNLSGLLIWCVILGLVGVMAAKVAPSAIEFYKIRKDIAAVANAAKPESTVQELRRAYAKYVEVDHLTDVKPEDLDISKEGNRVVISVSYVKQISLFGPVSLLIEYKGSSGQ